MMTALFDMFCGSFHVCQQRKQLLSFSNHNELILDPWIGRTMFEFVFVSS